MSDGPFTPTTEQANVINHDGPAFVSACPGAGKTRVMVERARHLLSTPSAGRGIAFLSFTNAAVSELEARLKAEKVLTNPPFPNFIGTFDSFLWQFLIAPFGVPGCDARPRLLPDKDDWVVQPFPQTNPLPFSCFDRSSGSMNAAEAKGYGYDVATRKPTLTSQYETIAKRRLDRALAEGKVDFSDVRSIVKSRLADQEFAGRLGTVLASRFREVIVDEAQDCNPDDLAVITWLRENGIATKVICDPQQAIYKFRGGITDDLQHFGDTFAIADRLPISGNFRSSKAICSAIVALRPPGARSHPDQPLGKFRDEPTPVHVLAYGGSSVPATIGTAYCALLQNMGLSAPECPVVASTWASACKAIGHPPPTTSEHSTLRLATAVTNFHFAMSTGDRREALARLHRVLLDIRGELDGRSYHEYLTAHDLEKGQWRPEVLRIARELKFQSASQTPDQWLAKARALIAPMLPPSGSSAAQRLRSSGDLGASLGVPNGECAPARTIHSVKGKQFPAICVVMTSSTANGILTFLESGTSDAHAEDARKIYVAASRAERLLVIAIPKSQSARLANHLNTTGTTVVVTPI